MWAVAPNGDVSTTVTEPAQNSIPVLPAAPVITRGYDGVNVSFQTPSDQDVAGYRAYVGTSPGFALDTAHLRYDGTATSFNIALSDDNGYLLRVAPYDAFGFDTNSAWAEQAIQRLPQAGADTTAPPVPDGVFATTTLDAVTSLSNVKFQWNQVSASDMAGYDFRVSIDNGATETAYTTTGVYYTLTGLIPGLSIRGRVRAYDKSGNYSAFSTAYTTVTAYDTSTPQSLGPTIANVGLTNVQLTWIAPTRKDIAYTNVYIGTVDDNTKATLVGQPNSTPGATASFNVSNLTTGTTYYFWIRAVTNAGTLSLWATHGISATTATVSAANVTPGLNFVKTLSALTDAGTEGAVATYQGKLYHYTSGAWTASVATVDLTGVISGAQIGAGVVDITKIASSLAVPIQLSSLSQTGTTGQYGAYQGKLYYYNGSAWVTASAAAFSDLSGQIQASQIGSGVISATMLAPGVGATPVVSSLPADNTIGNVVLLSTDWNLYRWNGSSWIRSINGADITGSIAGALIAAGSITTTQIADNSISTPKLVAGSVTATQIAAGTITAVQIQAGSITGDRITSNTITTGLIQSGAITTDLLGANSVTATKIVAGTITGDKIAANTINASSIVTDSITSAQIASGAITTSELAAGAVTADRLAVGNGANLLYGAEGFQPFDNFMSLSGSGSTVTGHGRNYSASYSLADGSTYWVREDVSGSTSSGDQPGTAGYIDVRFNYPTDANGTLRWYYDAQDGDRIIASVYVDCHRCQAEVYLAFSDGSGNTISYAEGGGHGPHNNAGSQLAGYERISVAATAPTGTRFVTMYLRKWNTLAGQSDNSSFVFFTRPQLEKAGANASVPSPWSANGQTLINGGSIRTASIQATAIVANSITAGQIAAGTITATQIAAATITGDRLVAGTITSNQIAAQAITASKIGVFGDSLFTDGQMQDASWWTSNANGTSVTGAGYQSPASSWYIDNNASASVVTAKGSLLGWVTTGGVTGSTANNIQLVPPSIGGVIPGETYEFKATMYNSSNRPNFNMVCNWLKPDGTNINSIVTGVAADSTSRQISMQGVAPAGASHFRLYWDANGSTTAFSGQCYIGGITVRQANSGTMIIDGTLTASKLVAGTITADKIAGGTITGDKISTSTSLPGTITVGTTGVSISTLQSQAANPAPQINANSTTILPGKILIGGSNTLSSWIYGGDNTSINGGLVATNTIKANSLIVGSRNLDTVGLTFQMSADGGTLTWSAGYILYTDDNNNQSSPQIAAGSTGRQGGYTYVYWQKGAGTLTATSDWPTARAGNGGNNVLMCSWYGNTIAATYGGTIIQGDQITTRTITSDRIVTGAITANEIAASTITGDKIAANTITTNKVAIGSRGVCPIGIFFTTDRNSVISWTDGYVEWFDEAYNRQVSHINAGSCTRTTNGTGVMWIWFDRSASPANQTLYSGETSMANVMQNSNNIMLAQYWGGNNFIVYSGGTIVDGDHIATNTINANKIVAGSITVDRLQDNSLTQWVIAHNSNTFTGSSGSGTGSGGGGGVTYCVVDTSFMPGGKLAGDMVVGDDLAVLNREDDMGYHIEQLVALDRSVQPCSRIETASGATLVVSNSTPITLRGGKVVPLMYAHGKEVPVLDDAGFRWEKIIAIEPVGELPVSKFFVNDGTYAAGEKPGRFIFTHNKAVQP